MRNIFFVVSCIQILFSATDACADIRNIFSYRGIKLGYTQEFSNATLTQPYQQKTSFRTTNASMNVGLNAVLGYKFTPIIALKGELEYLYRIPTKLAGTFHANTPISSTFTTQIHTILFNIYVEYYPTKTLGLYIGGGVGVAIIDPSLSLKHSSIPVPKMVEKGDFSWQVGIGSTSYITKHLVLDLNIRYADFGVYTQKLMGGKIQTQFPLSAVEILVTVAYKF